MKLTVCAWSMVAVSVAVWADAEQPPIANARVTSRSAASGLEREFRSAVAAAGTPIWIGYAVPLIDGERHMCCGDMDEGQYGVCCNGCALETGNAGTTTVASSGAGRAQLESGTLALIFYRAQDRSVGRIRTFSEDCAIDAGGLPVLWLTDVNTADSVALLATFAGAEEADGDAEPGRHRVSAAAVTAIAMHRDAAADRALDALVAPNRPESLRKRVTFWLGSARGRHGVETLLGVLRDDPSERVRESAIFALSVSHQPEALTTLIAAAREDRSSHTRGQALFWLAQKAGKKAAAAITDRIERDPDTEVKKKAVFALSQLPKDEGVPLLIQVARTHSNPAVRRQAMFWLGQSHDPRAVKFFEEILR